MPACYSVPSYFFIFVIEQKGVSLSTGKKPSSAKPKKATGALVKENKFQNAKKKPVKKKEPVNIEKVRIRSQEKQTGILDQYAAKKTR